MTTLSVIYPDNLQLLSLTHQREAWHCTLRCDESWKDDTGASLFGMSAHGADRDSAQEAVDAAVRRVSELVAEINAEIPLRKENRPRKTPSQEADEIFALLGL